MAHDRLLDGMHILIVEDEYSVAFEIKQTLTSSGAEIVRLSGEVSDALRRLSEERFDAALVDVNFRGDMAYKVAETLVRLDIPFVFATGFGRSVIPPRFGHVLHMGKPLDQRQMVAVFRDLRKQTGDSRSRRPTVQ